MNDGRARRDEMQLRQIYAITMCFLSQAVHRLSFP